MNETCMALQYNPSDLNDAHCLEWQMHELKLVMHKQHSIATMNLVTPYFWLMYITTGGYVPLYITSKVITLQLMRYVAQCQLTMYTEKTDG